eukprot:1247364-Amphidinium_carterae.1
MSLVSICKAKMQRLGPILDKLKSMDSKTFGALSGFLGQALAPDEVMGVNMSYSHINQIDIRPN